VAAAAGCLVVAMLVPGQGARAAAPACSVTWEGAVSNVWSNPANWSTGKVPGPSSDVCVTKLTGPDNGPVGVGKIAIHSLQVEAGTYVDFGITQGVNNNSASVQISDVLIDTPTSFVELHGTLAARRIDNPGALSTWNTASITSPALSNTGSIDADNSTLQLTDAPLQLHNGTMTGGTLEVSAGPLGDAIILPGDINSLAAGEIDLAGGPSSIEDVFGGNALASLSSIGKNATLRIIGDPLTINDNLVSQGRILLGFFKFPGRLDVGGNYTQTSTGTLDMKFGLGLAVGKTATLSGTLDGFVYPGCTPKHGTIVSGITAAARQGKFTTQNTPQIDVSYGAKAVQLQFVGQTNTSGCF
jgi:hypothetical protein